MPKPLKKAQGALPVPPKPKRPSDPMKAAQAMLAEHMSRVDDRHSKFTATDESIEVSESPAAPSFEQQYRAHMAKLGAKGGKISGAKRMQNLSKKQRTEIARKAATARWKR